MSLSTSDDVSDVVNIELLMVVLLSWLCVFSFIWFTIIMITVIDFVVGCFGTF